MAARRGGRSVSISCSSMPSAYWSAAGPVPPPSSEACSGAMYAGVPVTVVPSARAAGRGSGGSPDTCAMPQSIR